VSVAHTKKSEELKTELWQLIGAFEIRMEELDFKLIPSHYRSSII
jgi:hypothetical protein